MQIGIVETTHFFFAAGMLISSPPLRQNNGTVQRDTGKLYSLQFINVNVC